MLYTIAVVLLVLWAVGLLTAMNFGGLLHLLLVVAVVVVLLRLITGRRVL
ncbi:MAG TPA: lmo0937 family membrane protein [Ramlibacter sp.]|nr:lmo0937 family membrane protein [Ramlibacter sp.]